MRRPLLPAVFFVTALLSPAFAVADAPDSGRRALATDTAKSDDSDSQNGGDTEEIEDIEEIEELEVIETVESVQPLEPGEKSRDTWSTLKILGRLHPAAVHFPIGGIALALVFAFLALRRDDAGHAARLSVWFSLLAAGSAILTGFLRSDEMRAAGAGAEPINLHRNVMLLFVVAALLGAFALLKPRDRRFLYAGFALILVAFILVSIGGHLGGRLVYGNDYLPF